MNDHATTRSELVGVISLAMQCSDLIHEKLSTLAPTLSAATATVEMHRTHITQLEVQANALVAFVAWVKDWHLRQSDERLAGDEFVGMLSERRLHLRMLAGELTGTGGISKR